jgi:histidine triad (HIT) family protein
MASIFSKIVAGDIPCYRIAENDRYLAFLDISPLRKGHTLVIPKKEVDELFDLDADTYSGLMDFARDVATALKKAVPCNRIGLCVIGLEVPHAHIHLIPINSENDMNFRNEKLVLSKEEFETLAATIRTALS